MFTLIKKEQYYSCWCICWCLLLSINCVLGETVANNNNNNNNLKEPSAVLESIVVAGEDGETQTATEILQLPHAFRHQQHYAHRIEQAVNDFKLQQQQQQQTHLKERDKNNITNIITTTTTTNTTNNNTTQFFVKQQHQRRHEHHWLKQHQKQQRHHLRHCHHHLLQHYLHHQQQQQQQKHHNERFMPTSTTIKMTTLGGNELDYNENNDELKLLQLINTTNNKTFSSPITTTTHRYFDRDGLFKKQQQKQHQQQEQQQQQLRLYQEPITRGPYTNNINHLMRQKMHKTPITTIKTTTESPRLSLTFNTAAKKNLFDVDYTYEEFNDEADSNNDNNNNDDDDDDDDNLLYNEDNDEDDDDDDEELDGIDDNLEKPQFLINNSPPLSSSQTKSAIKRYTNPFRQQEIPAINDHEEDIFWNRRLEHIKRHYLAQQEHRRELKALIAKHGGNIGQNVPNKQQYKKPASHFTFCIDL